MLKNILVIVTKNSVEDRRFLTGPVPEHGIHRRRVNNFIRIEDMPGVPAVLDLFKQFVVVAANHLLNKFSAKPPVTMFAAERTLVFFYQSGNIRCDGTEHLVAFFRFQVDDGPKMYLPRAGMGIVNGMK